MQVIKVENYEKMSRLAANIIAAQVLTKPESVLGLATGSTPLGTYSYLAELCQNGDLDFSKTVTVNLDEYVGLLDNDTHSYRQFMNDNFFDKINIDKKNTYVPNGCPQDLSEECNIYDERIKSLGGIDIQLLGIGVDGHIGFNEPDDVFVSATHVVTLDESTIKANARFFDNEADVPRYAITMGMVSIMHARKIVLIANGKNKKAILEKAFFGPITPKNPASILQLHPDITVIYTDNE